MVAPSSRGHKGGRGSLWRSWPGPNQGKASCSTAPTRPLSATRLTRGVRLACQSPAAPRERGTPWIPAHPPPPRHLQDLRPPVLGLGVKQRRPPSSAGLSFPTDTRAGCQRQHSHALPPPHPCSRGLEPQPLLFLLLCLALAPDPPGSQQGGGWGRGSWCGLPQRLPVNPHLSALLSWKAPGCQRKRGFLAALPATWSQISEPRVRER